MTVLTRSQFHFDLPPALIAQSPAKPRDSARLLHVGAHGLQDRIIRDLPDILRPGDLLIGNDTKVIPARLYGQRGAVKIELLLHRRLGPGLWEAFAKPGKRLRPGDIIVLADGFTAHMEARDSQGLVHIQFNGDDAAVAAYLARHGQMPLPPYIKRGENGLAADRGDYQTIFAAHEGAIAAPTAGLHFTPELLEILTQRDIERATVTLHVGAGTFLPVKAEHLADHVMHREWGEVTPETAATINRARAAGGRIIAVGTTSLRLLETACDHSGQIQPWRGETDIFLYPGKNIRSADLLLTNFHLPESTLFMLVCAFTGMARMQEAYHHAITQKYRFYSYGDACLLERDS